MPLQRLFAVDVNRCSNFIGDTAERNIFTIQFSVPVSEIVHKALFSHKKAQKALFVLFCG
jgi:hypothetical protein